MHPNHSSIYVVGGTERERLSSSSQIKFHLCPPYDNSQATTDGHSVYWREGVPQFLEDIHIGLLNASFGVRAGYYRGKNVVDMPQKPPDSLQLVFGEGENVWILAKVSEEHFRKKNYALVLKSRKLFWIICNMVRLEFK